MSQPFIPKVEIPPASQRRLGAELVDVPKEFVLSGGTAIALQLEHGESVDFDFVGTDPFDSSISMRPSTRT